MAVVKVLSGLTIGIILVGIAINLYRPKLTEETKQKLSVLVKRAVDFGREYAEKFWEKPARGATKSQPADTLIEESERHRPDANGGDRKDRLLTKEELAEYDGRGDSPGLYLAVLGKVYDVTKGAAHYKPGAGYAFFTGKDASKAYITGDFSEDGLSDDVLDLKPDQLLGLEEWTSLYEKEYDYVGKLVGRYYDNEGQPTDYYYKVESALEEARATAQEAADERKIFPPCNSEWSHQDGGKVWCSKMSGGIEREWAGVPRKLYKPGQDSSRCVCVRNYGLPTEGLGLKAEPEANFGKGKGDTGHPHLREYDNCHPEEVTCAL